MHKITSQPITLDCFEIDDYDRNLSLSKDENDDYQDDLDNISTFEEDIIYVLENIRQKYLDTKIRGIGRNLLDGFLNLGYRNVQLQ